MYNPYSWKDFPILQQPSYDADSLKNITKQMHGFESIVSADDVDKLAFELAEVENGNKIIVQLGDCAETFADFSEGNVEKYAEMFEEARGFIESNADKKCVVIGRIAGQFGKPRSDSFEEQNGLKLPVYRGDIANGVEFDEKAREYDAQRLISAYEQSKKTVEIIDNYSKNKIYTSHEALVLDYDAALTREVGGKFYCLSAHMLWIGYRTAQVDHAHVEFLRGIENPIGIKVGTGTNLDELVQIINKLNPQNKSGKIVLILRFGADKIESSLAKVFDAVKGLNVVFISDPMHGNGYKAQNGYKTRAVNKIAAEVEKFVTIARNNHVFPAGLHLEATAQDVIECVLSNDEENLLGKSYKTACDPRLNREQLVNILEAFCV